MEAISNRWAKEIRKIILFQGGVETLDFFGRQMGLTFEEMGISVFYFDLQNAKDSVKRVQKFIKSGETVLLTFNFEALEREAYIYHPKSGYVWQGYDLPLYNIVVDHPYYYHNRLMELKEDALGHPGLIEQYHHISIDRIHQSYFRRFYPEFQEAGFLPLAGTNPFEEIALPKMSERTTDIIFTGNYTEPAFFEKYAHHINEEYAAFYHGMMDDLIKHPDRTVEEVEMEHCFREMGEQTDEDMRLPMHRMIFIDMFVRNYFRGEVIRILVEHGFSVKVIGAGWEKLPVKKPNRMAVMEQTDSLTCLRELRNSRVSVNVMPWFKDGTHDRVLNSILNGAVCFTDGSKYQKEILPEGAGVSYYSLKDGDLIAEQMEQLLSDVCVLGEMAQKGMVIAKREHTWKNRAVRFLEIIS